MLYNNSKQRKIKDLSVNRCSDANVKNFEFVQEKDFLCQFLPKMDFYNKKNDQILKLKRKLSSKIYLKYLQSFKEQLLSDLSLLKKEYSPEVIKKYEEGLQEEGAINDHGISEEKQKQIKQKQKIEKIKEDFQGNFDFFKADVQIGKHKNGKLVKVNLTIDIIQGYFDKSLYKTEFALGFNYYETNYGALEIITKYNKKQSDIFMNLSNILNVGINDFLIVRMFNDIIVSYRKIVK